MFFVSDESVKVFNQACACVHFSVFYLHSGRIALKLEAAADVCVNAILELIEHRADYVLQESVVSMRDVFR